MPTRLFLLVVPFYRDSARTTYHGLHLARREFSPCRRGHIAKLQPANAHPHQAAYGVTDGAEHEARLPLVALV
jgi:hypothetical protein